MNIKDVANKVTRVALVILIAVLIVLTIIGFSLRRSYREDISRLQSEISVLGEQYGQMQGEYLLIKISNDSLSNALKDQKTKLRTSEQIVVRLKQAGKIILDSIARMRDDEILPVLESEIGYMPADTDKMVITPLPVLKTSLIVVMQNKQLQIAFDTAIHAIDDYRIYSLGLERLVAGKDKEIGVAWSMNDNLKEQIGLKDQQIGFLNKDLKREKFLKIVFVGTTCIMTGVTAAFLIH